MSRLRKALLAQGVYYVTTGVAPFVSRRLFERITGPKADWWLVQSVGGLVTAIGAAALVSASRGEPPPETLIVAAGGAATLAGIDVAYVTRGSIPPAYLADAAVEVALLAVLLRHAHGPR